MSPTQWTIFHLMAGGIFLINLSFFFFPSLAVNLFTHTPSFPTTSELREAFTAKGNNPHKLPYLISIAAPAGINKFTKLDLSSMCASLDWVNLMAYDIHGPGENLTNHQAAIYDDTPGAVGPQNSISAAVSCMCVHVCDV